MQNTMLITLYKFSTFYVKGAISVGLVRRYVIFPIKGENKSANYSTSTSSSVVPVQIYSNADTQKAIILKETKGLSGIYSRP